MEFKGKLGNYQIVETNDGTFTVHSEFFNENCHSTAGAYEETIYNYIEGCEVERFLAENNIVNILEIGFGVAVGAECLLDKFLGKTQTVVNFVTTEIDRDFAVWALEHSPFAKKYREKFEDLTIQKDCITFKISNFNFIILVGDARETLPTFRNLKFHCVFQDAFSPKKNPTLWTVEWFKLIYELSDPSVILSTYSSHMSIRASLLCAGFLVETRKGFGMKRTCTRASRQEYKKLTAVMEEIKKHAHQALTDSNYQEMLKD
ncbi:S-adenosyl-L-methionine-dependent methyltransferase [Bacteriovorax sp. Seq25_V]|nr:S-adenosyl-L-methionine-dependent methyltransferase [Bacteriovorax sp. Seq25_V]